MEMYTSFAQIYDTFMDNVDYAAWCAFLLKKLAGYNIRDGLVCDLGCGTGNMTELLAQAGFDMIGVDASADMLSIAQQRQFCSAAERGELFRPDILYLQQDMRELELYGTVRAVVSVCDSINYLTTEEDLRRTFSLVNNYLDPAGLFLFDVNTGAKYEKIGEDTIAENRPEGSFIWENHYDEKERINEYELTLFLQERDGRFTRREENHVQRAWTREEIESALKGAGLLPLECCEAYTGSPVTAETERLFFLARESGKQENERQESGKQRSRFAIHENGKLQKDKKKTKGSKGEER